MLVRQKEDFNFLIGKTLAEANDEIKKSDPYFIFVGERDGKTFYRTMEFNNARIVVSVRNGHIFRIDSIG